MRMMSVDLAVDAPLAVVDDDDDDLRGVAEFLTADNNDKSNSMKNNNFESTASKCGNGFAEEALGGSLEDLVSNFDEKLAKCLTNFDENAERLAPVQIRTQEEIMNESQIWWTLTGNFGNILPIDWSKTYARKLQLPALHLEQKKQLTAEDEENRNVLDLPEDEELTQAFDLHSLIVNSVPSAMDSPPQTADEVIDEIDEIMQNSVHSEMTENTDFGADSFDAICSPLKSPSMYLLQCGHDFELECRVRDATFGGNLKNMSYKKLVVLHSELESLIQIYNETLVQELANRDELEYEKELKNTFISLLLSIQNKRRQYHLEKKRKSSKSPISSAGGSPNGLALPQYLTAVIPYQEGCAHLDCNTLQALIKILRAVNENHPNVPTMLTDYILNVLCPSSATTPIV